MAWFEVAGFEVAGFELAGFEVAAAVGLAGRGLFVIVFAGTATIGTLCYGMIGLATG